MRTPLIIAATAILSAAFTLAIPHLHAAEPMMVSTDCIGRYRLERVADNIGVLVDTRTGRLWKRFISTGVSDGQWSEITVEELAIKAKQP